MLCSTILTYIQNEFNSSNTMMGFIAGIFIVGALIGRIVTGFVQITKKVFIVSMVIYLMTILLYFIQINESMLIAVRLLNGLMTGITTTIVGTIIALVVPKDRRSEGISYFALSTALATGFGPFLGISVTQGANYMNIFYISLLFAVLSVIVLLGIHVPSIKNEKSFSIKNLLDKDALPIAFIIFLSAFSFSGVVTYINLYANEINLVTAASYFFIIYTVSVIASRPFTGKIADLHGANVIMYPALILFLLGLAMLSLSSSGWMILLAGLFVGLGFGNISSITQAIAVSSAKAQNVGLAMSTFMIFMDLGNGLGPYGLGFVIPILGYSNMYAFLAILMAFTLILYYFLHGRKSKKQPKSSS
ncbi:MFS transporter [Exiguobacterium sp. s143]|uniref:MFS transporter n=1 Tax=Exiguobacterium sp. s143 TaxID=2751201 RepID=UPI001BEC8614|nr:MFS transporter [Exiguobacterium sp. s143]